MIKFLLIIFLFIVAVLVVAGVALKRVKNFLFGPIEKMNQQAKKQAKSNVIYEKDDVVVMKGEAGKSRDNN